MFKARLQSFIDGRWPETVVSGIRRTLRSGKTTEGTAQPMTNIVTVTQQHVAAAPGRVAARWLRPAVGALDFDEITYHELDAAAQAKAGWLQQRIGRHEPVIVALPHGRDLHLTLAACLYAGVVMVVGPLPDGRDARLERLAWIQRDTGARLVLTDADSVGRLRVLLREYCLPTDASVEVCGEFAAGYKPVPIALEDLAFLQYTSGATSHPKGAAVQHGAVVHNLTAIAAAYRGSPDVNYCGWLPFYHDMGLVGQFLYPLFVGGITTLLSTQQFLKRPLLWLQVMDRVRANCSATPNFGLDLCLRAVRDDDLTGLDLSCLRTIWSGAEPVDPSTIRRFAERLNSTGLRRDAVKASYGMAEATLFISGTPLGAAVTTKRFDQRALEENVLKHTETEASVEIVSCGRPPSLDVVITDPHTGNVLSEGLIGEIWVQGGSVIHGYWRQANTSGSTVCSYTRCGRGPFLRTGDLGGWYGGELYVTGRLKDVLVINGRRLYPHHAERLAEGLHKACAGLCGVFLSASVFDREGTVPGNECVMIQEIRKARWGDRPLAELAAMMRERLTCDLGVDVRNVLFVRPGTIPKTTSGKPRRHKASQMLHEGNIATLYEDLSSEFLHRYRAAHSRS